MFRYRGRDVDPVKTGKQLKVQALVTGKVQQRGDLLSVQAELVDAKQNAQLWGDRFNRRGVDLLNVEDNCATDCREPAPDAHRGRARAAGEARYREHRRLSPLSQGTVLLEQAHSTRPEEEHRGTFEGAIAERPGSRWPIPDSPAPYVVMTVFDIAPPTDLFAKAKTAVLHALEVDSNLAEALAELSLIGLSGLGLACRRRRVAASHTATTRILAGARSLRHDAGRARPLRRGHH